MNYQVLPISAGPGGETAPLHLYLWDNSPELDDGLRRPLVLLCPGGGYAVTSDRRPRVWPSAFWPWGSTRRCCAIRRLPPATPAALLQLAGAVALIRRNADPWYVDPARIVVQGSSAGGHLAGCLGVFWREDFLTRALETPPELRRPNGLILSYPVVTAGPFAHRESFHNLLGTGDPDRAEALSLEKRVNRFVPPVFLWHTWTDQTVPVENSLLLLQALREHGVPTEFHLFPVGRHGLGTAGALTAGRDNRGLQPECAVWMDLAGTWLHNLGRAY